MKDANPASETIRLPVTGMTCASCVGRVERALSSLEGVEAANVNLASETARIRFHVLAGAGALISALDKAGYPARRSDRQVRNVAVQRFRPGQRAVAAFRPPRLSASWEKR